MKKIINNSKDDLLFPRLDLHLSSGEIKIVSDEVFKQLSGNSCIKEVVETKEVIKETAPEIEKTNEEYNGKEILKVVKKYKINKK